MSKSNNTTEQEMTPEEGRKVASRNLKKISDLPSKNHENITYYLNRNGKSLYRTLRDFFNFVKFVNPEVYNGQYCITIDNKTLTHKIRKKTSETTTSRHMNLLCSLGFLEKVYQNEEQGILTDQNKKIIESNPRGTRITNVFSFEEYTPDKLLEIEEQAKEYRDKGITSGNVSQNQLAINGLKSDAEEVYYNNSRSAPINRIQSGKRLIKAMYAMCYANGYVTKEDLKTYLRISRTGFDRVIRNFKEIIKKAFWYKPPNKEEIEYFNLKNRKYIYLLKDNAPSEDEMISELKEIEEELEKMGKLTPDEAAKRANDWLMNKTPIKGLDDEELEMKWIHVYHTKSGIDKDGIEFHICDIARGYAINERGTLVTFRYNEPKILKRNKRTSKTENKYFNYHIPNLEETQRIIWCSFAMNSIETGDDFPGYRITYKGALRTDPEPLMKDEIIDIVSQPNKYDVHHKIPRKKGTNIKEDEENIKNLRLLDRPYHRHMEQEKNNFFDNLESKKENSDNPEVREFMEVFLSQETYDKNTGELKSVGKIKKNKGKTVVRFMDAESSGNLSSEDDNHNDN